jgi:hypothetical protein
MPVTAFAITLIVEHMATNAASRLNISARITTLFGLAFALIVQSMVMKPSIIVCSGLSPANKMQNTLTLFATNQSQGNTTMAYIIEDLLELAGIASFVTFITFLAMAF